MRAVGNPPDPQTLPVLPVLLIPPVSHVSHISRQENPTRGKEQPRLLL